ncbi:MAG: helix-turn-helix transcriptional regulator [Protaetiibacter sp.]
MSPTTRLLDLLSLLQTRRDWPGAVLANRLEVSHRTVRRDIDRLRDMGYRIEATMGPDGGYRLEAGSELPPLLFDDDQAVAVAVALRAATTTGAGIDEAALRALTTVRQVMPSHLRHRLDSLAFTTLPRLGEAPAPAVSPDVLVAVSSAVRAHEVLRFDYASREPGDEPVPRRVEPHELIASHGRWYLLAWDLEHDDWRIFRADRMTPRPPTRRRFASRPVPGGDARAFVAARFAGASEGGRWPCVGTVVVHLPADAVRPFAGDSTVERIDDMACRMTAGAWSWVALAASLSRFDAPITVERPPELTAAFGELAARAAATARGAVTPRATEPR